MSRTDWQKYFFKFATLASERATCIRRKVGAVLVKENMVIATGYNGPPRGVPHCNELGGCTRTIMNIPSGERHELCRGLHAEQNAIIQAARSGLNINGADLYCSYKPCSICTKMIINAGISKVFYYEDYHDPMAESLIKQSTVQFIKTEKE